MPTYYCGNCDRDYDSLINKFPDIPDLLERIAPGEPVPSGECPDCGALVHEIRWPEDYKQGDDAARYCMVRSIEEALQVAVGPNDYDPGATYGGYDEFLRHACRAAADFERWACRHVDFENFFEVWPYYLEENFGAALLSVTPDIAVRGCLDSMTDAECRAVAQELKLPLLQC